LKNRGSILKRRPKILIDTSFILPALGFDVEDVIYKAIEYFNKIRIYYIEESILEAMWKIIKVIERKDYKRIEMGLHAIRESYNLVTPSPEAYVMASKIFNEGHKDYIDNLLYATSIKHSLKFLTTDDRFIDFLEKHGYYIKNIVYPENIMKIFE